MRERTRVFGYDVLIEERSIMIEISMSISYNEAKNIADKICYYLVEEGFFLIEETNRILVKIKRI